MPDPQLEGHLLPACVAIVQLEKLGHHDKQLALKLLNRLGFSRKPRHVRIRDVPHASVTIPLAIDCINLHAIRSVWTALNVSALYHEASCAARAEGLPGLPPWCSSPTCPTGPKPHR